FVRRHRLMLNTNFPLHAAKSWHGKSSCWICVGLPIPLSQLSFQQGSLWNQRGLTVCVGMCVCVCGGACSLNIFFYQDERKHLKVSVCESFYVYARMCVCVCVCVCVC